MGELDDLLGPMEVICRKTVSDELFALPTKRLHAIAKELKVEKRGTRQVVIDRILNELEKNATFNTTLENKTIDNSEDDRNMTNDIEGLSLKELKELAKNRGLTIHNNRIDLIEIISDDIAKHSIANEAKDSASDTILEQLQDMSSHDLKNFARSRGLTSNGCRTELMNLIISDMSYKSKSNDQILLEKAIMSWSARDQEAYLAKMKLPTWGTKPVRTHRIIGNISIDDAAKILQQYKTSVQEYNTSDNGELKDDNVRDDFSTVETMEVDKDDWNTIQKEEVLKRKRDVVDIQDSTSTTSTKASTSHQDSSQSEDIDAAPPKIVDGKTGDRDTTITASARGGNDLPPEVDEAGWQPVRGGDGDNEPVQTKKTDNVHRTRIGLHFTPPPSTTEPDRKLWLQIQKWFTKMRELDESFILVPWKKEEVQKPLIRLPAKIPTTMSKMKVYFNRVQARSGGGRTYTDVYVQHSVPIDDLRGDAEWFLTENNMGMYHKKLQVEATSQMGWLLYSTQSLDQELLESIILARIGVPVALRWKFITTEKYETNPEIRKKWMALHLEVSATDTKKAARGLSRVYGSTSTKFPLGIRMRLISEYSEVKGNPVMMGKHMRLRLRQASFLAQMVGRPSDDIMLLDYTVNEVSLRGLIMGIQSRRKETPGNLFHAVGKDWKGRIILNFLKIKSDEAMMIVDGLIPYLTHKHGDVVHQFFDPEAVIDKADWEWDDTNGIIINPLSRELDGLDEVDKDYDFSVAFLDKDNSTPSAVMSPSPTETTSPSAAALALSHMNLVLAGQESDSVSSMGNPLSPAQKKDIVSSHMQSLEFQSAGASVRSEMTLDSRVSALEENIVQLETNLKQTFNESLNAFFLRLQQSQAAPITPQPPGGASAGEQHG